MAFWILSEYFIKYYISFAINSSFCQLFLLQIFSIAITTQIETLLLRTDNLFYGANKHTQ